MIIDNKEGFCECDPADKEKSFEEKHDRRQSFVAGAKTGFCTRAAPAFSRVCSLKTQNPYVSKIATHIERMKLSINDVSKKKMPLKYRRNIAL